MSLRALLLLALAAVAIVPQVTLWSTDHDIVSSCCTSLPQRGKSSLWQRSATR
jgi:hypothetical protein